MLLVEKTSIYLFTADNPQPMLFPHKILLNATFQSLTLEGTLNGFCIYWNKLDLFLGFEVEEVRFAVFITSYFVIDAKFKRECSGICAIA